jgi:hypothetical protein
MVLLEAEEDGTLLTLHRSTRIVELGTSVKTMCNWHVVWLVLSRETANGD